MKAISAFLAGLASAFGLAWLYQNNETFRRATQSVGEDLRNRTESAAGGVRQSADRAADAARRAIFTQPGRSRTQQQEQRSPQGTSGSEQESQGVDLNSCSREELISVGLSTELADRVIENRPYRNRLDLMSRLVIPEDVYESVKNSIRVDDGAANEPIKVAS